MAPQTVIRPIGGVLLNVIQAGLLTVSESKRRLKYLSGNHLVTLNEAMTFENSLISFVKF